MSLRKDGLSSGDKKQQSLLMYMFVLILGNLFIKVRNFRPVIVSLLSIVIIQVTY